MYIDKCVSFGSTSNFLCAIYCYTDVQLILQAQRPCRERKASSLASLNSVSSHTSDLSMGRIHVSEFIQKLVPHVRSLCGTLV